MSQTQIRLIDRVFIVINVIKIKLRESVNKCDVEEKYKDESISISGDE